MIKSNHIFHYFKITLESKLMFVCFYKKDTIEQIKPFLRFFASFFMVLTMSKELSLRKKHFWQDEYLDFSCVLNYFFYY